MRILECLIFMTCFRLYGEVWFIPGWRTGSSDRAGCVRILQDIYPGQKIRVCSWDSRQKWSVARRNAGYFSEELFHQFLTLPEVERKKLILVGHSAGGAIVVDVLSRLARGNIQIDRALLLATALPCDDPRIFPALNAVRNGICNVYNPGDWVLKYLYTINEDNVASLGYRGWSWRDHRFTEIQSDRQDSGFAMHYAYLYLETFDRKIKSLPQTVAVRKYANNQERIPADNIFWQDSELFENWKIQIHYDGRARLLDPAGVRRSAGTLLQMREAMSDVKKQLQQKTH